MPLLLLEYGHSEPAIKYHKRIKSLSTSTSTHELQVEDGYTAIHYN